MTTKFIGDLHFPKNDEKSATLIIGHHILTGKIIEMDKPFVAVEKQRQTQVKLYISLDSAYFVYHRYELLFISALEVTLRD